MPDFKDLAREVQRFRRDLVGVAERANKRTGEAAMKLARAMSAGEVKTAILSRPPPGLNHPYGLGSGNSRGPRGPIPYNDAAYINRQSGIFIASWKLRPLALATPVLILFNQASYASYLEKGTSKMIARPLQVPVEAFIARTGPVFFREEFDKAWRVRFGTT